MLHFQFINKDQIDRPQWDYCINQSGNGLIYGQSFFLDNISPGWGGLVGENYDWVLPVVSNKKFGITYVYQPPFAQQFGIYAKAGVEIPYQEIITWLKANYRFWEINWNASTSEHLADEAIIKTPAANFVLDLSKGYDAIAQYYHNDLLKNLKRSSQFGLSYQPSDDYGQIIDLYIKHYATRIPNVLAKDFDNFKKLCHFAKQKKMLLCKNALNGEGNVVATALLLTDGNRLYNMMNTTTNEGRKISANHFLIDSIIGEFSGQPFIFDFEGSDLPGVKSFYENFGSANETYYQIKYNNLPWHARLFKR